jgi:hypothetical protein
MCCSNHRVVRVAIPTRHFYAPASAPHRPLVSVTLAASAFCARLYVSLAHPARYTRRLDLLLPRSVPSARRCNALLWQPAPFTGHFYSLFLQPALSTRRFVCCSRNQHLLKAASPIVLATSTFYWLVYPLLTQPVPSTGLFIAALEVSAFYGLLYVLLSQPAPCTGQLC